jgi:Cys-rich protein (TIGR01571 family)
LVSPGPVYGKSNQISNEDTGAPTNYAAQHQTERSAISTSPVSPGPVYGKINQVSNEDTGAPPNYAAQHPMSVPKQMAQGNTTIVYTREIPENRWSKDLFDCAHNIPFCLAASICPCVTFGLIYSERQLKPSCVSCMGMGFAYVVGIASSFFFFPLFCWMGGSQRKGIRADYHISGDGCEDMMLHLCCVPCAMTQEMNEVKFQKELLRQVYPEQ